MEKRSARATYQHEKEKAQNERRVPHEQLMAEAKIAFEQQLADGKAARKSGRPKNVPKPVLESDDKID